MKQSFMKTLTILTLGLIIGLAGCNHDPENAPEDDVILTAITLNTTNVKKVFTVGDEFTTEGLVVTAVYSDETTKEVTGWTVSETDLSKPAEKQTITISYTEDGKTVTSTYTIEIKEKTTAGDPENKDPGNKDPDNTPSAKLSFDIKIDETSEIKLIYTIINDNEVSFEVPDEYVSYTWFVRDIMEDETSHKLTINMENTVDYRTGMNGILVIVKNADGTYNSASGNIYIQR